MNVFLGSLSSIQWLKNIRVDPDYGYSNRPIASPFKALQVNCAEPDSDIPGCLH